MGVLEPRTQNLVSLKANANYVLSTSPISFWSSCALVAYLDPLIQGLGVLIPAFVVLTMWMLE